MLTDLVVKLGDKCYDFPSKELFSHIRTIAEQAPGTVAAHIVALENFTYGGFDNIENPEEGFYRVSNFGNLLEALGFEINRYPETVAMSAQTKAREEFWAKCDEAKAKGEAPPVPGKPLILVDYINAYGVADNLEQVKVYLKEFIDDPGRKFVIEYSIITKDPTNFGQGGGWRWHKWGPYIGVQKPTTEYLDDEPEIDQVYIFHIYEVLNAP